MTLAERFADACTHHFPSNMMQPTTRRPGPAVIVIENQGPAIVSTNFWDSNFARVGYFFLSWNAGTGRLLVPDTQQATLQEMHGANKVIVSRGPWLAANRREAIELLWEDDTDAPFAIQLVAEQTDRFLPDAYQGGGFEIAAWTRSGVQERWPGCYRRVASLPCLEPWTAH